MARLTSDDAPQITPARLTKVLSDFVGGCRARGGILIVVDHGGNIVAGGAGLTNPQQAEALIKGALQLPMAQSGDVTKVTGIR